MYGLQSLLFNFKFLIWNWTLPATHVVMVDSFYSLGFKLHEVRRKEELI